jgi:hypothetical protein
VAPTAAQIATSIHGLGWVIQPVSHRIFAYHALDGRAAIGAVQRPKA